jgi:hypothetical protein
MKPIFEIIEKISDLGDVIFSIEYSIGENPNELEFEAILISDKNNLTFEQKRTVEEILENGLEEKLVIKLANLYKETEIKFLPNHYEISYQEAQ